MVRRKMLFIAVCASLLLRVATAATVTVDELTFDATGRCVPKTSDVCNGVAGIEISGMIFVNDARNESSIAASALSYMTQLSPLVSVAPQCYSATVLFLCLAAFNPCESRQVNASFSVAVPSPPCQAVCDNGLALCADTFKQFNRSYPACPDTVVYDFTQSGAAATFTPNCSSGVAAAAECRPIYEIYIKPPVADRWYTALRVLGWIGLVMNIALIALYVVNTRLPAWPGPLILLMAVSQGIFALALCMCSFSGRRELMCDHSKVCKAQAAFIYIGALFTMTIWLLLIGVTLALVLSRNPKRMQSALQRRWYWSLLALIVPTLFCGLAFRDLGPKSFAMLCTSNDGDNLERFVIWPVAGLLALGTVAWVATVVIVLKNLSASLNWRRDLRLYLRLLIYELIAFLPAILLVVPFESIRNRIKGNDSSVLRDGSARRVVESINTGAMLSPIFFAALFLAQPAHFELLAEKVGYSTTTRSGSSHPEEKEETSKF